MKITRYIGEERAEKIFKTLMCNESRLYFSGLAFYTKVNQRLIYYEYTIK